MKEDLNYQDRRAHPRIAWHSVGKMRPYKSSLEWETSRVRNIGLGGCYFLSDYPYQPGDLLEMQMQSKFLKGAVRFIGTVKRCEKKDAAGEKSFGIALHFMEVIQDEKDDFVQALRKLAFEARAN